ncbi:uncharacterized protein [Ptychodera flava]|uniref:uncharacterized protein n=1 Tax=Ptychodera flava TaxID=63121 RepID=UPI00396A4A76
MATSRQLKTVFQIALTFFVVLAKVLDAAPTIAVPAEDESISDSFRFLYQRISAFHSDHVDIFDNFKSLRLDDQDIMNDVHSFTFEGLPIPVSRFFAFRMKTKDLLVLHRDNFQAFESFVEVMYKDELDHESSGLPHPFHDDFSRLQVHLRQIVVKLNSLLHTLGHTDSVDTEKDVSGTNMINSVHIRDMRHAKVLNRLSNYLPSARQDIEVLQKRSVA